jgi:sodium/potassium/calcium exchanger 6
MCPCITSIANTLQLSDSLAGVTILALGNSIPDVFNALSGQLSGHPEIFFSSLMGKK